MYTIGQIARRFGLSRSTLIYYDKKGLLRPSGRSEGNYRAYSEQNVATLERILLFRNAGLPLSVIGDVLSQDEDVVDQALESRLSVINREIQALRVQQQVILSLIKNRSAQLSARYVDRETWVDMLRNAGLDEQGMHQWHREFEGKAPEAHRDFLESVGFAEDEITKIRAWSQS